MGEIMSTERRIYRNLVMRKYEEVRSLISQYLNHFTLVSDIDSSLLKEEGDYLSLLSLSGLSISNEEFKARKVLLDLLKASKKIFYEVFNLETLEAKVLKGNEEYQLIFIDGNFNAHVLVTLGLVKEENYLVSFNYDLLVENIDKILSCSYANYRNITFSENQIAILEIKNNKNEVKQKVKEIKSLISSIYTYKVEELNSQVEECEKELLDQYHIIIEVGPSNVKKKQLTLVTKDSRIQIEETELLEKLNSLKEENTLKYYKASLSSIISYQKKALDVKLLSVGNRFCCCLDQDCLSLIEEKLNTNRFYLSFSGAKFSKKCIVCQKNATSIIFGVK